MKKKEESAAAKSKTSTRKRKEAEPADGGTGAEVEIEPENVKKPTTRGRKKKVQEKVEETQPESGEAAPSEKASKSDLGEKPKAKAKSKVKEKAEPKKEAIAKRAAKAKAKRLPKKAVKDDESGDEEETDAQKLRKKLFQSDDDGSDESEHERYDAKTGKVEPLKDILEKCEVDKHKAKNRKLGEPEPEESTPKKAKGGKNKNKTKVKKVDLSPFTKKEVSRRKRKEKETMHQEAKEDEQIQGIVRQHLKNVEKLTYEDVKLYLRKHLNQQQTAWVQAERVLGAASMWHQSSCTWRWELEEGTGSCLHWTIWHLCRGLELQHGLCVCHSFADGFLVWPIHFGKAWNMQCFSNHSCSSG